MATLLSKHCRKHTSLIGLTLIEVLIALAIIAIAMTAVIKAVTQNIQGTNYLQEKTISLWVGELVLNEARVGIRVLPAKSEQEVHTMEMLGRNWYWRGGVEETPNKRIRKIAVDVFNHDPANDENMNPLVTLESYV